MAHVPLYFGDSGTAFTAAMLGGISVDPYAWRGAHTPRAPLAHSVNGYAAR
jgi:hypothetical protein